MKIGETWKMKDATLKALFEMGAHPMSVGSPRVKIVGIKGEMIEYTRAGKEHHNFTERDEFIRLYERDYSIQVGM